MNDKLTPIVENSHNSPDIDADPVIAFMSSHIQRRHGSRVAWDVLYEWFADSWADGEENAKALSAAEFGAALAFVCQRANIRVRKSKSRVYCCNVRLIDPSVKALAAPADTSAN